MKKNISIYVNKKRPQQKTGHPNDNALRNSVILVIIGALISLLTTFVNRFYDKSAEIERIKIQKKIDFANEISDLMTKRLISDIELLSYNKKRVSIFFNDSVKIDAKKQLDAFKLSLVSQLSIDTIDIKSKIDTLVTKARFWEINDNQAITKFSYFFNTDLGQQYLDIENRFDSAEVSTLFAIRKTDSLLKQHDFSNKLKTVNSDADMNYFILQLNIGNFSSAITEQTYSY